jgi:hypothetical protein
MRMLSQPLGAGKLEGMAFEPYFYYGGDIPTDNGPPQMASVVAEWVQWQQYLERGCVPSAEYCRTCYQNSVCDWSCFALPVCGGTVAS